MPRLDRRIDLESPSTSFQARKTDDLNEETDKTNLNCDSTDNTEKTPSRSKSKIITHSPEKQVLNEKEKEKKFKLNTSKHVKKTKRVLAAWDADESKKPKNPAPVSYVCKDFDYSDSDSDVRITLANASGNESYWFPDVEK
ncbi:hypothetical protein ILUMI_05674 [Ignelater luminosus]|uniref:Uncharacterized protein n=1 Tax=Ignelater luminosus TaxID=2038154 RepID=A0A8K0DC49_IGNLU|nr:hypothetical protein ILUMI_05674 [Ignelater luminosus]